MSEKLRTMLLVVATLLLVLTLVGCGRRTVAPVTKPSSVITASAVTYVSTLLPSTKGQRLAIQLLEESQGSVVSWLLVLDSTTWQVEWQTNEPTPLLQPLSWRVDSRELLYLRASETQRAGAYAVALPSGIERRVLPPGTLGINCLWSPDGRQVFHLGLRGKQPNAVASPVGGSLVEPQVYSSETGKSSRLDLPKGNYQWLAVTPGADRGGSKVLLLQWQGDRGDRSHRPQTTEVWAVTPHQGPGERVFTIPNADRRVAVSPSGKLIACGADGDPGMMSHLELHSGVTGELLNQVEIPRRIEWLSFSPDEKAVLGSSPAGAWLWLPSSKDSAVVTLSELLAKTEDPATKVRLSALCWLGDNQHVVAARGTRLWLLDLKANTATQVVDLAKLKSPAK